MKKQSVIGIFVIATLIHAVEASQSPKRGRKPAQQTQQQKKVVRTTNNPAEPKSISDLERTLMYHESIKKELMDFFLKNPCPIKNWTKQDQDNTSKWFKKAYAIGTENKSDAENVHRTRKAIDAVLLHSFVRSPYQEANGTDKFDEGLRNIEINLNKSLPPKSDDELLYEQMEYLDRNGDYYPQPIGKELKDFFLKTPCRIGNWTKQDQDNVMKWVKKAYEVGMKVKYSAIEEIIKGILTSMLMRSPYILTTPANQDWDTQKKFESYVTNWSPLHDIDRIKKSPRISNEELLKGQVDRLSKNKNLTDIFAHNKMLKDFCFKNLCPIGNWTKEDQINTAKWLKEAYAIMKKGGLGKNRNPYDYEESTDVLTDLLEDALLQSPYYLGIPVKSRAIVNTRKLATDKVRKTFPMDA